MTDKEVIYDARPLGDQQQAGIAAFLGDLVSKLNRKVLPINQPLAFVVDSKFATTEQLESLVETLDAAGLKVRWGTEASDQGSDEK